MKLRKFCKTSEWVIFKIDAQILVNNLRKVQNLFIIWIKMKSSRNKLDHVINRITQNRLWHFWEYVKIEIHYLVCNDHRLLSTRSLNLNNIARLVNIFKIQWCSNLELEYCVVVVINEKAFTQTLFRLKMTQMTFFSLINSSKLEFNQEIQLQCLYDKHCFLVTEKYEKHMWLIKLYLKNKTNSSYA